MLIRCTEPILDFEGEPLKAGTTTDAFGNRTPDPMSPDMTLRLLVGRAMNYWADDEKRDDPDDSFRRFEIQQAFAAPVIDDLSTSDADYVVERCDKAYADWPLALGRVREYFAKARQIKTAEPESVDPALALLDPALAPDAPDAA